MKRKFLGIPIWIIGIGVAYVFREKLKLTGLFDKVMGLLKKSDTGSAS
ncbi:MAG: hypothetical protein J0I84_20185 [Terrimonas sp.]|nr:hypothetical protein [Terrimonas sp.]